VGVGSGSVTRRNTLSKTDPRKKLNVGRSRGRGFQTENNRSSKRTGAQRHRQRKKSLTKSGGGGGKRNGIRKLKSATKGEGQSEWKSLKSQPNQILLGSKQTSRKGRSMKQSPRVRKKLENKPEQGKTGLGNAHKKKSSDQKRCRGDLGWELKPTKFEERNSRKKPKGEGTNIHPIRGSNCKMPKGVRTRPKRKAHDKRHPGIMGK